VRSGVAESDTTVTSAMTSSSMSSDDDNLSVIIAVSVVGGILLVVAVVLLAFVIWQVYLRRNVRLRDAADASSVNLASLPDTPYQRHQRVYYEQSHVDDGPPPTGSQHCRRLSGSYDVISF